MNTEVITTHLKEARDKMYEDLRENGNEFERQVVRFSDCEQVNYEDDGSPEIEFVWYEKGKTPQERPVYRSTWSLAYPRT